MEKYGVGTSTCRLALAPARAGRLHPVDTRQGYLVTPITLGDVEELFALRLLLEPAAAKPAAGQADVRALAETYAEIRYQGVAGSCRSLDASDDGGLHQAARGAGIECPARRPYREVRLARLTIRDLLGKCEGAD